MSRFNRFLDRVWGASRVPHDVLMCDFGSQTTKILVNNKLLFQQPTCVAIHVATQAVVEVGDKALALVGKTPSHIQVLFPIEQGMVAHPEYASLFLQAVLQRMVPLPSWPLNLALQFTVGVPTSLSRLEADTFRQVCHRAGLSTVHLVTTAQALAQRLERTKHSDTALCAVNIGAQMTELLCFSGTTPVIAKTIPTGGQRFTDHIKEVVRNEYKCEIGWQTAERIKLHIGRVIPPSVATSGTAVAATPPSSSAGKRASQAQVADQKMVIRGKDVIKNIPTTIAISAQAFYPGFGELVAEMCTEIQHAFAGISPEIVAGSLENGIFLTGGGSLLPGLSQTIAETVQSQAIMSPTPKEDIVRGLAL